MLTNEPQQAYDKGSNRSAYQGEFRIGVSRR